MTDVTDMLRRAPFNLDDSGVDWVKRTKAGLSPKARLGQLFTFISMGRDPGELDRLARLQPAGITRMFSADRDFECGFMDAARGQAQVPMLVSADLEGSRMSLAFGTEVPNPLALAAVDDVQASRQIARIMAQEARAIGVNWTFTPVLDINAAFRSPIVATRGFGADVARIERQALAQMEEFQAAGVAATVKHWPGEGFDDRDQHLVTTINPLSMAEWELNFGRLYRAAIDACVLSVMSAHIALPAFVLAADPNAGVEAYRPASVSRALNVDLLRGQLGFNGVIVSDATPMAGLGAWGPREVTLPEVIANGCDMILFTHDPEADMGLVAAAIADGRITAARLDEALTRVLGLKAALGLQNGFTPAAGRKALLGTAENKAVARAVTARAPTLVKDVGGLLPLSVARTKRVLVMSGGIVSPIHPAPGPFEVPDMLRAEGFDVTLFAPGMAISPDAFDLMIYLFGEETLLTRGRIFLDWAKISGGFQGAMRRHWHEIPTLMISFGYPYYLYDAPRVPTYVNAYSTMSSMQVAVVECLMGRAEWQGKCPVDAFCGLPDARS